MTRLIEIFYDDKKEHREIGSGDLPLEVYLTQGEECELFISSLKESSEQIEKEQIQEEQEKNIYGYIAEDDNHLFFQPDKDGLSNNIFHNDEIKKSVWLKSGDIIQINKKIIIYSVSGDKILMTVTKNPEAPVIIPPLNNNSNNQQQKTSVVKSIDTGQSSNIDSNKKETAKTKNKLLLLLLVLLILLASFVLFAQTAVIIPVINESA